MGQTADGSGVAVTIVRASKVGVKVGTVGRGVIVCVGGTGVRLGVDVGGMIVGVAEGEGSLVLSMAAGMHAVKINIPKSRLMKNRFIVFLPLLFPFSSIYNGIYPTLVPSKKLIADR